MHPDTKGVYIVYTMVGVFNVMALVNALWCDKYALYLESEAQQHCSQ